MPIQRIEDQSQDRKYFTVTPRLVWFLSRDPYDYTLWNVVKDVAGDDRECYLSTPDLATLAMMSEGKVHECREHLISCGLLEGELRKDPGYPVSVWHLSIPDLWESNLTTVRKNLTIADRIRWKQEQKGQLLSTSKKQKACSLCGAPFTPPGRRSHRCPTCQKMINKERKRIYEVADSIRRKEIKGQGECADCGATKSLELHLVEETQTNEQEGLILLCRDCHNKRHRQAEPVLSCGESTALSSYESTVLSWDENRPLSDESGPSPHERKKNQKKNHHQDQGDVDDGGRVLCNRCLENLFTTGYDSETAGQLAMQAHAVWGNDACCLVLWWDEGTQKTAKRGRATNRLGLLRYKIENAATPSEKHLQEARRMFERREWERKRAAQVAEKEPEIETGSIEIPVSASVPPKDMAPLELQEFWQTILGELQLQMTKATFDTWLRGSHVVAGDLEGDTPYLIIRVRHPNAVDWLENRLQSVIDRTVGRHASRDVAVAFTARESGSGLCPETEGGEE